MSETPEPPAAPEPPPGPPGGGTFSLEGRPVPALYLGAWILAVGGLAVLFLTTQMAPGPARTVALFGALLAIALGLAAGAGYQVVARAERDPDRYRGPSPFLAFGLVVVLSTLVSGLLGLAGIGGSGSAAGFLLGLAVVGAGYLLVTWLFVVRTGALPWSAMGWPVAGPARIRRGLAALGTGIIVALPATLGILILGALARAILDVQAPQILPPAEGVADRILLLVAVTFVAPVGEELFFRGYALTAWARDLPERSALVRSAVFFALVHIANIGATTFGEGAAQALLQVAVIAPLAIVLGILHLRRGVVAAIGGHVTYNAVVLVLYLAIGAGAPA